MDRARPRPTCSRAPAPRRAGMLIANPPYGVRLDDDASARGVLPEARRRAEAALRRLDRVPAHRRPAARQADRPEALEAGRRSTTGTSSAGCSASRSSPGGRSARRARGTPAARVIKLRPCGPAASPRQRRHAHAPLPPLRIRPHAVHPRAAAAAAGPRAGAARRPRDLVGQAPAGSRAARARWTRPRAAGPRTSTRIGVTRRAPQMPDRRRERPRAPNFRCHPPGATPADAPALLSVHARAIRKLAATHYTEDQRDAWIARMSAERLRAAMSARQLIVAEIGARPRGRASSATASCTRSKGRSRRSMSTPTAPRRGVGRALFDALQGRARALGSARARRSMRRSIRCRSTPRWGSARSASTATRSRPACRWRARSWRSASRRPRADPRRGALTLVGLDLDVRAIARLPHPVLEHLVGLALPQRHAAPGRAGARR